MMRHMEKYREGDHQMNRFTKGKSSSSSSSSSTTTVWDCGSTLYDSYELNYFKRQIDSAIANSPRTFSMPHLQQERRRFSSLIQPHHHHHQQQQHQLSSTSSSSSNKSTSNFKIPRTLQKLLGFVFKSTNNNKPTRISSSINSASSASAAASFKKGDKYSKERVYVVYDKSDQPVLSTIPELPEIEIMGGGLSPDITSFVNKSASERFPPTTTANINIGISCA